MRESERVRKRERERGGTNLVARWVETASYHLLAFGKESPGFSQTAAYTFMSSLVRLSLKTPRPKSLTFDDNVLPVSNWRINEQRYINYKKKKKKNTQKYKLCQRGTRRGI